MRHNRDEEALMTMETVHPTVELQFIHSESSTDISAFGNLSVSQTPNSEHLGSRNALWESSWA